jgi:hypothetical protein
LELSPYLPLSLTCIILLCFPSIYDFGEFTISLYTFLGPEYAYILALYFEDLIVLFVGLKFAFDRNLFSLSTVFESVWIVYKLLGENKLFFLVTGGDDTCNKSYVINLDSGFGDSDVTNGIISPVISIL